MTIGTSTHVLLDLWHALGDRKIQRAFSRGDILFACGTPANFVYLIDEGQVKLVLAPAVRSRKAFEIAGPGAVLGLSEVMTGSQYNLSAEALEDVTTAYVDRSVLMEFLRDHQEVCMQIVRLLSEDLHSLYFRFRAMTPDKKPKRKSEAVM